MSMCSKIWHSTGFNDIPPLPDFQLPLAYVERLSADSENIRTCFLLKVVRESVFSLKLHTQVFANAINLYRQRNQGNKAQENNEILE
jgi:hypothetical protein